MKKWLPVVVVLLLSVVLSGCGSGGSLDSQSMSEHQMSHEQTDTLTPVEVAIITDPEQIKTGESAVIMAEVTEGEEKVDDADQVMFEVWKGEDKANSEMIKAEHHDKGVYFIEKTFPVPGTYYVTAHVDARGMHTMPTKELTVE